MGIVKGYVSTADGQIHYRMAGRREPGRPALVLLHQTASSSAMYSRLLELLEGAFFCFAPDTPGFGGTDALPEVGSIGGYARALLGAIDRMELDRFFLFGHHSGASIATEIAATHPERVTRLVLGGPPLLTRAQLESLVPTVCPVEIDPDGAHLMAVWRRIRVKDPAAPLDLAHREAVLNLLAGVRYPEAYKAVFAHDLASRLAAVECPTLVFAGPDDTIRASLEPAHALLRRGSIRVLPRGSTYICDREPELVAEMLRDFLLEGVHA